MKKRFLNKKILTNENIHYIYYELIDLTNQNDLDLD
jgi:protein-tyrosine phosphatase